MALAAATASSSVVNVVIGATGPKISSVLIAESGGYVDQHRRVVEVAGPVGGVAAHQQPGAVVDGVGDQLAHRLDGLLVDQRADVDAVVLAAADGERAHPLGQPAAELLGDVGVHEEAVGRGAGLAHVAHLGDHRAVDGRVEVGVGEDEERGVAAELHADPLQLVGALAHQHPAGARSSR